MLKSNNEQKDKINILLNIDNFYGKHTGGMGHILLFVVIACAPFLIYSLLLMNIIPFTLFIIPYVLYVIRMALMVLGREKERKEAFKKKLSNQYASSNELISISHIYDTGLIEYQNGTVAFVLQAYSYSYMDDNSYSKDLEEFLSKLTSRYNVDIHGHLVVHEFDTTQEDLEKMRVYSEDKFMEERLHFYEYQTKFSNDNSKLYRLNFVVTSYKSKWEDMYKYLSSVIVSDQSRCFDSIKICNKVEVTQVLSRDLTLYVDLASMLRNKNDQTNYYGSKILYYGNNIPDNMLEPIIGFDEEDGRRVKDDN